jgi:excisionase family DNA binding protein
VSIGKRSSLHTFSCEGKSAHVNAKEHTMSTTTSNAYSASSILTIDQAAEYLAIPKATLYTWRTRRAGFGPRAAKFGSCLRYRRSDLDAWIADHLECFDEPTCSEAVQLDTAANHADDSAINSRHSSRGRG